jgi:hypothetical protein
MRSADSTTGSHVWFTSCAAERTWQSDTKDSQPPLIMAIILAPLVLPIGRTSVPNVLTMTTTKAQWLTIGLLGNGNLAVALGRAWAGAHRRLVITGRDPQRVASAAAQIGDAATAVDPADFAGAADVVVVAVSWDGLEDAVGLVGGGAGRLAGATVIDCTNAVDYATGRLRPPTGSAAEVVAHAAPGARVVKALHLFAGTSWPYTGDAGRAPLVGLCADDRAALRTASSINADLGARTVVLGGLDAARQAEEAAGFVMRVVAAGGNPRYAVPDVVPAPTEPR